MKRCGILVGSVLAFWATVSTNADIRNGSFDDGLFGWTDVGEVSIIDVLGDPAARLGEPLLTDTSTILQQFEIDAGPEVTLSFSFAMFSDASAFTDFDFPGDALLVSLFDPSLDPLISNPFATDFLFVGFDFVDPFDPFSTELAPVIEAAPGVEVTDITDLTAGDVLGVGGLVTVDVTAFGGTLGIIDFTLAGGFDGLDSSAVVDSASLTVIPIPASIGLALVGFASLAGLRSLRRRGFLNPSAD